MRASEDIIAVWTKHGNNAEIKLKVKEAIKRWLSLPATTGMEYKEHDQSLHDKSSFRNANVYQ